MTDQLHWDDQQRADNTATPGDAPAQQGVSQNTNDINDSVSNQNTKAAHGDAMASPGVARANGLKQDQSNFDDPDWPTPGDAALTVDETRLRLLAMHDIYHKERYTQKLRTDYHKLDGRRLPKAGGGVELKISQSSIDKYAADFNKDRAEPHAAETPLDPTDKLFAQLREIAGRKPYGIIVDAERPASPSPQIETPPAALDPTPSPAPEENVEKSPDAIATPIEETETPPAAPNIEQVKFLEEMFRYFKATAEDERSKKETALKARDDDREAFDEKLQNIHKDHQAQQNELIDELAKIYNAYSNVKEANARLTAAYTEAKAKLPPGIDLSASLHGTDNPAQPELIPATKPTNVRFGQTDHGHNAHSA